MNARHLIVTLALLFAAGATVAALKHGPVETPRAAGAAECAETAAPEIPRVVITARRGHADAAEAPIARVVVTARRNQTGPAIAAASN
ncbi:MAG: hypothetical protein A3I65_04290 [Betaproteobacteria bacterium RIFCSPLOWO2_02_FULL_68_150]|nr:MAG: hypothetical protein A3I65_04290 [Betaproteobacteria bacterium RIFCSPLOWO2_02_FULL_68_150]